MSKYSKELLSAAVAKSSTWKEVCARLGVKNLISGAQSYMKNLAVKYSIDFSHFPGQSHTKNKGKFKSVIELLKPDSYYKSTNLRTRLIREGFKEEKCEKCGIVDWMNEKAPLELDHIDGDHFNNTFDNLQILCANCHALKTRKDISREKKTKVKPEKKKVKCPNCDNLMSYLSKTCRTCADKLKKEHFIDKGYPSKEELSELVKRLSKAQIARDYKVSDHAVAHWCKVFGIETPKRGYGLVNKV